MNKGSMGPLRGARFYHIVPFAMEGVGPHLDSLHFFIGDLASSGILAAIEPARHFESFSCRCLRGLRDELNNRFVVP